MSELFVRTGSVNEEILGIDTDHMNLCNIKVNTEWFPKICEFISTVLEDARFRIVKGSPVCELRWQCFALDSSSNLI